MPDWMVRPLTAADVLRLTPLDWEFTSDRELALEKETAGLAVTWRLTPRRLAVPFRTTHFAPTRQEWAELAQRLAAGQREGFVAAVDNAPVALIELEAQRWRNVGFIWNLLVHRPYRRQGIGAALFRAAVAWGQGHSLRALALESQTNNWPALSFYHQMGFSLCAIDDHFYSNEDVAVGEIALFFYYELEAGNGR